MSFTQYLESQEDQDMTRLLNFTRTQERRRKWVFVLEWIYSSGGGNMNEMPFNGGWQRIMNLDLILAFREIWYIKCEDWWEWGASKVRFSRNCCNIIQRQLWKIISDLILIGIVSFLCSNWSPGCLVSGKINLIHKFKIF